MRHQQWHAGLDEFAKLLGAQIIVGRPGHDDGVDQRRVEQRLPNGRIAPDRAWSARAPRATAADAASISQTPDEFETVALATAARARRRRLGIGAQKGDSNDGTWSEVIPSSISPAMSSAVPQCQPSGRTTFVSASTKKKSPHITDSSTPRFLAV